MSLHDVIPSNSFKHTLSQQNVITVSVFMSHTHTHGSQLIWLRVIWIMLGSFAVADSDRDVGSFGPSNHLFKYIYKLANFRINVQFFLFSGSVTSPHHHYE